MNAPKTTTTEIEIQDDEFIVIGTNKSISIHRDSLSDEFYKEYEFDIKNEIYYGEFDMWIIDNDKCLEYLRSFVMEI